MPGCEDLTLEHLRVFIHRKRMIQVDQLRPGTQEHESAAGDCPGMFCEPQNHRFRRETAWNTGRGYEDQHTAKRPPTVEPHEQVVEDGGEAQRASEVGQ